MDIFDMGSSSGVLTAVIYHSPPDTPRIVSYNARILAVRAELCTLGSGIEDAVSTDDASGRTCS